MKKTTLVIDEVLVDRAQAILGTRGLKATIDRALTKIVELDARRRAVAQLEAMDRLDLDREAVLAEAWQ